jgi:gluconolactonase
MVHAQWRYSDTKIVEVDFTGPGADGQPTGKPVKTYDYLPHAGGAAFDDSGWERISPESLVQRRSTGRLCFNWYRTSITLPEKIGDFSTLGSTVVFETSVDDYAEVWIDGELTRAFGQRGGSVVAGWNASNRLIIGRDVKPGQKIQLAIFGANGPLSNPPTNFIWMRLARLDFYQGQRGPVAITPSEVNVEIVRKDPAIDDIVGPNPKIFKLAGRVSIHGRTGLGPRRRLPDLQRSQCEYAIQVHEGRRTVRLPASERLLRCRYCGIQPARIERIDPRRERSAYHQRTR